MDKCKDEMEKHKPGQMQKKLVIAADLITAAVIVVIVITRIIIPYNDYNIRQAKIRLISQADPGSIVTFGKYEQDNDASNGKEDIEWLVLEKADNRMLLISRYALNRQQYNEEWTDITWESCSLRKWLNDTFLEEAFDSDEQAMILETVVPAEENPDYNTDPGNETSDKVFLLSIQEAEEFFPSDGSRRCAPTDFAAANGAYTSSDYGADGKDCSCWWWLRSPGSVQYYAAYVTYAGPIFYFGSGAIDISGCVRPALWITLESGS